MKTTIITCDICGAPIGMRGGSVDLHAHDVAKAVLATYPPQRIGTNARKKRGSMAMDKLLPCPFCGSTKQTVRHSARWGWFVSCECAAVGPSAANRKQAVEKWNSRKSHQYGYAPQMTFLDEVLPYE